MEVDTEKLIYIRSTFAAELKQNASFRKHLSVYDL